MEAPLSEFDGMTLESFFENVFDDDDESDSDAELEEEPELIVSPHRFAVSAEAYGQWNKRGTVAYEKACAKNSEQEDLIRLGLMGSPYFHSMSEETCIALVAAMPIQTVEGGTRLTQQGDLGDTAYILVSGSADCFNEDEEMELDSLGSSAANGVFERTIPKGRVFGEMAMLWSIRRTRTIVASGRCEVGVLSRELYQTVVVGRAINQRNIREDVLRSVKLAETLDEEAFSKICDVLTAKVYAPRDVIIRQGDYGQEMFVVLSGECVATVETGSFYGQTDVQEHRRYKKGDLFGERALLQRTVRAATVVATTRLEVLVLSRRQFERMLGPLSRLQQTHYLADPRKRIADFFLPGDRSGPRGMREEDDDRPVFRATAAATRYRPVSRYVPEEAVTEWFAVFRPTSRDALQKMLSGAGVGKALNVKGKSSKKNWLSGFVPFVQISDDDHKAEIDKPSPSSRVKLFFTTQLARELAQLELEKFVPDSAGLAIDIREINLIDDYPDVYGLDLPEPVLYQAYIAEPELAFEPGWDTGRNSEPAFMDMNLHALRDTEPPQVVLYQIDKERPMNPHGLLVAYAENYVKPVVSDFDTFTIGSMGFSYEPLPPDQVDLALWSIDQTWEILRNEKNHPWTARWLNVVKKAEEEHYHPKAPGLGFGDPTSSKLIENLVSFTQSTGAVRHGAECFNFWFPQDLDDEYLIVWKGFPDKPWIYKTEPELRDFLSERIVEGFSFPVHPVWPLRDQGWWRIFEELSESEHAAANMKAWYPPSSGIMERMNTVHKQFPDCFQGKRQQTSGPLLTVPDGSPAGSSPRASDYKIESFSKDLQGCEQADFIVHVATLRSSVRKIRTRDRYAAESADTGAS